MWMRSCAVCKLLLQKLRLCDSVRCKCGWEWHGCANETPKGNLALKDRPTMAKIIEFYIPGTFRKNRQWIPLENRGKIIQFTVASKKTA